LTFEPGSGILHFGNFAFQDCSSLQSISIPRPVGTISMSCFEHCWSLASLALKLAPSLSREPVSRLWSGYRVVVRFI
jgi:hypothetical protein